MPRLVNRSQMSAAARASPPPPTPSTDLPPYQPPCCPLTESGRRALCELSRNRRTALYEAQLKDSLRQLGSAVGLLHERLGAQANRLDAMRGRRQEKGSAISPEEQRLEEHLSSFENTVADLTLKSERAVRDNIDKKVELEDDASVLADLFAAVTSNTHSQVKRRHSSAEDDMALDIDAKDTKDSVDIPSTLHVFRERRAEQLAEYTDKLTPYQRYARNNDYASFKKLWHDAAAGENGPPLPDASKWFSSNGQPLMDRPGSTIRRGTSGASGNGEEEDDRNDDDDDDIAVAREVLSLNCPLTLRPMEEPYSSVKCHHTFEKSSLLDYLPVAGKVQCPQTGCSQTFSRLTFEQDFELNQVMLRRIQRSKQTARHHDLDEDIEENTDQDPGSSTDQDESIVINKQMRAKGRSIKEER